ncbi:MAG: 16S rRNA (guanine(527)-N(7))-methyltransferase RsmG [Thermodesulfobacteriota bacterium]|nr:16S rRNA (guanine(527)-N(7))-methyltransferase RsmG [Thermodesulfobacteriota bacterium]
MKNKEILTRGLDLMGLQVAEDAVLRLDQYFLELVKWNQKMNLVAKGSNLKIIENHFLDSLTLLPIILDSQKPTSLLDVGTGAGFPGLVLKAVFPELILTLMEPRLKRVSFLKQIIRTLGLSGVTLVAERLNRDYEPKKESGLFTLITSRALTRITDFLDLSARACRPEGKVICMKGPNGENEVKAWKKETPNSPFQLTETLEFRLPFSNAIRTLFVFTKKAGEE